MSIGNPYTSTLWSNRTVGLLGGSFNPAHRGHRHISLYALKMLGLDAVWWMVSPQNPLKPVKDMALLDARLKGAADAARHPKIFVTDIERHLGTQYTADTITALQRHFPRTRFVWLMGTDNLKQFHKWKRWQEIFKSLPVCVLDRPPRHGSVKGCPAFGRFRPYLLEQADVAILKRLKPPAWTILHIPLDETSATAIRAGRKKKT